MSSIGTVGVRVVPSLAGFGATVSSAVAASGPSIARAGAAAGLLISAPIGLAIGGSISAAVNFESGFAGVEKTVGGTAEEMAKIKQELRDTAKELPFTHAELNRMAEAVGRFGVAAPNIGEVTEMFAKLGVAIPEMDSTVAAENMVRFFNVMGTKVDGWERNLSAVVDLGNNLPTSEQQIIEFSSRLAQVSAVSNVTEADVLGLGAAFSSLNIRPMAGASSISRVFFEMDEAVKGNVENMGIFTDLLGITEAEFQKLWDQDPAGLFVGFLDGLKQFEQGGGAITDVLGQLGINDIRVRRTLLAGMKDPSQIQAAIDLARTAAEDNNALQEEFETRADTTAAKWKVLKNRIFDVGITLGDALIPALLEVMDVLDPVIELVAAGARWFTTWPEPLQAVAIGLLAVAVVAGPLVFIISQMITVAKGLNGALLLLKANPIMLLFLAIAAIVVVIIMNWDTLKQWFMAFFEWFYTTWDSLWNWFFEKWNAFKTGFQMGWEALKNWISERIQAIIQKGQDLWDKFIAIKDFFLVTLPDAVGRGWDWIVEKFRQAKDAILEIGGEIAAAADRALGPLDEIIGGGVNIVQGGINAIFGRAGGGGVLGGKPYLVGERGPEIFVPGRSGSVIPNGGMGGMNVQGPMIQVNTLIVRNDQDIYKISRQLAEDTRRTFRAEGKQVST